VGRAPRRARRLGNPRPVPDLRDDRVPQLLLAGALSQRVRDAVEGWLAGWDANGAEWDFWVERNEEFRSAIARLLHAEADDVAVTTSVSQGVSGLVSALALIQQLDITKVGLATEAAFAKP
jgi:hypothetical protein